MEQPNPFFSLEEFKSWMDSQKEKEPKLKKPTNDFVGLTVESKISINRLMEKIDYHEGDIEEIAKDFRHNGGTIKEVEDINFIIEVDSGSFCIPRYFVRKV